MFTMTTGKAVWGRNIRNLREKNGLSQRQLAVELGVTQASVSQWESGSTAPRDELRIVLARFFAEDYFSIFPVVMVAA